MSQHRKLVLEHCASQITDSLVLVCAVARAVLGVDTILRKTLRIRLRHRVACHLFVDQNPNQTYDQPDFGDACS